MEARACLFYGVNHLRTTTDRAAGLMWLWQGLTTIPMIHRGWAWSAAGGRPPSLLSWEVTEPSFCLSGGGELHGCHGCGFRCDKSQRGERMCHGN